MPKPIITAATHLRRMAKNPTEKPYCTTKEHIRKVDKLIADIDSGEEKARAKREQKALEVQEVEAD